MSDQSPLELEQLTVSVECDDCERFNATRQVPASGEKGAVILDAIGMSVNAHKEETGHNARSVVGGGE